MLNFLESDKSAKEFIEDVTSNAISAVTDAPPETRIKPKDEETEIIDLN